MLAARCVQDVDVDRWQIRRAQWGGRLSDDRQLDARHCIFLPLSCYDVMAVFLLRQRAGAVVGGEGVDSVEALFMAARILSNHDGCRRRKVTS